MYSLFKKENEQTAEDIFLTLLNEENIQTTDDICKVLGYQGEKISIEDRRKYFTEIVEREGGTEILADIERKMTQFYIDGVVGTSHSRAYLQISMDARLVLNKKLAKDALAEVAKLNLKP